MIEQLRGSGYVVVGSLYGTIQYNVIRDGVYGWGWSKRRLYVGVVCVSTYGVFPNTYMSGYIIGSLPLLRKHRL
ncbi:MAG: hypothetical protein NXY57DRAFT_26174 [Lentinula lateritia]|nr:MAG: hypothetical protein NXY57DRAFT_26174 [Lentinula lateritia]